jgi:hypothetical protein
LEKPKNKTLAAVRNTLGIIPKTAIIIFTDKLISKAYWG